jgi:GAF domain-containing protein
MRLDGERAELLYAVTRGLATCENNDELVRFAARRLREVFDAEGCAILLLDPTGRTFRIPIASQRGASADVAGELRDATIPSDQGIAGAVLKMGEAILVEDAQQDPRFFPGIDRTTGLVTRRLMVAPLRSASGTLGVVEVVNPEGASLGADDLAFLNALATDIGVAYEKARLHARQGAELVAIRRLARRIGLGMIGLGCALVAATAVADRASTGVTMLAGVVSVAFGLLARKRLGDGAPGR